MKNNVSRIWILSKEEFQKLVDESNSIKMIMDKLCLVDASGSRRIIKKRFQLEGIDLTKLNAAMLARRSEIMSTLSRDSKIPDNKVFVENSTYCKSENIKDRLLDLGFKYECSICKINSWLDKRLSLQLDHINGVNNDNRLNNLRLLCPNCHSQTETFSGKHRRKIDIKCCFCGVIITKNAVSCVECSNKNRDNTKIEWPSREYFEKVLWEKPTTLIAIDLGVSDQAVSKHVKKLGLIKPGRAYWVKLKYGKDVPRSPYI